MDISATSTSVKTDSLDSPIYCSDDPVVREGQEAWGRLSSNMTWDDWKHVGKAHLVGRQKAMTEANVNRPIGRRYNKAFGAWLREFGFENLNIGDRARLFEVMGHFAEIDAWLATLTTNERVRLNHPTAILRKWKGSTVVPDREGAPKPSPYAQLKNAHAVALEENHRLRRSVEASPGNAWKPTDTASAIADAMLATLSPEKAEATAKEILKKVKERKASGT
ncbi:hypothetical protein G6321_00039240 [Bradyrhizobium barranii subsp. barranii]|uniref:Uncharacterized protein n=1 Tax=Bradyrhizobium barranii subsp. barranii TaxID=2823807 RepID=A0A7Z0QEK7_9BRAD|nr:hypothetical protein [Bradyrhizobium barranii]UGX91737.1 hypothetical protein G6321_00039240 [Bradyrhizobium barranii subsp. barranii]